MGTKIGELLGEGGFGDVYLEKKSGKPVAIKTYYDKTNYIEIDIMSTYFHPNVMECLSIVEDTKPKVVMPVGRPILSLTGSVMSGLIQGLAFLHSRGVLHLDVKDNNMLMVDDVAKLIDFGHSLISSPEQAINGYVVHKKKYVSPFVAPELCKGFIDKGIIRVSTKTDIFALAWSFLCLEDDALIMPTKYQLGKIKPLIPKQTDENYDESYYYHQLFTKDPEKRMKLIKKTLKGRFSEKDEIFIHSMLAWNPEDRPSLQLTIPGQVRLYVPKTEFIEFPTISNIIDLEDDVIIFFMALDMYYRTGYEFFYILIFVMSEYGRISFYQKPFIPNIVYQLGGNMGSCNLLYRISNSIECLVAMVNMMKEITVPYSEIDFYKLKQKNDKKYKPGDKTILAKDFYKLLQ